MKLFILTTNQFLPVSAEEVWDFISSPSNLKKITPEYMGFEITSGFEEQKIYQGMIISYIVKPLLGIPLKWVTEITHVEDLKYFVDEQRFGPYKFWHHKHFLEEVEGGVMMRDIIHYALPLGVFSSLINAIVVERQLNIIFEYRSKELESIFGKDVTTKRKSVQFSVV